MGRSLHFEAPTALEYFASLVADDASMPLIEAAAAVAQDEYPQLDPQDTLSRIDSLADRLKRRLPADAGPMQRLRLLNRFFFGELGFAGNVNNYADRRNSYLSEVLETRRGIPITLALVYIEIASQIGLSAHGIAFPGHFLVKLRMPRGEVVIDPFSGQSLSREDLDERLAPFRHQRGLVGEFEAPLGLFLQSAPPRDVIARLLRNLKELHRSAADWPRLVAVLDRLVILLPQVWEERRDRAVARAALGHHAAACEDLELYLRHRGEAEDASELRLRLAEWRTRPRLH
ncbi:MAG: tetratricopeptide repeat protein [Burkholderiales bacterium]|nr:tetratricopeptide repeat protein [Burkholderiales bacterium]MDE2398465.1 tetratricopeptide repeat protein [Burkholderiales bacterium]MDE2454990.1 tetratricopeptide repeat protein [Burkholderiales bacterium]